MLQRHKLIFPMLAVLSAVALATPAAAAPVRYELDSASALEADGWTFISDNGTAVYASSGLTVTSTKGYVDWLLRATSVQTLPATGWIPEVRPGRGYWVEARLKVSDATACTLNGPGFRVDDGKTAVVVSLETAAVHVVAGSRLDATATTTDDLHTYRLTNLGGRHYQLSIDGNVVLDAPSVVSPLNDNSIAFGDMGGCDSSASTWDYIAYDTFSPTSAAGDTDADGVPDASDNCPLVANADQANADADGTGDACDLCPADANDDQDNDGLCAADDPCPTDTRNDQDKNGICDTQQCIIYETSVPAPPGCPSICHCPPPVGYDPIGGYGGGLGNFAGNSNSGMGGTGTAGGGAVGSGAVAGARVDAGGGAGKPMAADGGSSGMAASAGNGAGASLGGAGPHGGAGGQGDSTGTSDPATSGEPAAGDHASGSHGCGCAIPKERDERWRAWLACGLALVVAVTRRRGTVAPK